jgi:hypothetical protein
MWLNGLLPGPAQSYFMRVKKKKKPSTRPPRPCSIARGKWSRPIKPAALQWRRPWPAWPQSQVSGRQPATGGTEREVLIIRVHQHKCPLEVYNIGLLLFSRKVGAPSHRRTGIASSLYPKNNAKLFFQEKSNNSKFNQIYKKIQIFIMHINYY